MELRRIRPGEGARLRELRLRALADAPDAFATTLAEAQTYSDEEWERRAAIAAEGSQRTTFIAIEGERWLGMAGGIRDPEQPDIADLVSMWVAPEARGLGAARALIEAVVDWARAAGVTRLQLWVTDGNAPAIALYRRAGFQDAGVSGPLDAHPGLTESMMARDL
jgi:GNAT superfamily N-acetyltransferase